MKKKNSSLVTLITPVYNAMPFLPDYLDSVLAQTWRPLQLICVDDGSEDNSFAVLREYKQKFSSNNVELVLLQQTHSGQANAFNKALQVVKGDFITWCDADDLLHSQNIEKKAEYLTKHPDIDIVRNDGIVIDGDTGKFLYNSARSEDKKTKNIFDDLFRDITYCYAGCYMLRTRSFFSVYQDKKIPSSPEGQNIQLLFPLASRGDCGFVDEELHKYVKRKSGHSSKQRSLAEQIERLKNFTQLKKKMLDYCSCDEKYYSDLAEKIEKERIDMLLKPIRQSMRSKHEGRNTNISQSR